MNAVTRSGSWLWAGLLLAGSAMSDPMRFEAAPGADGTRVEFESKAPLETFRGHTDQVSGTLILDPADLGDSIEVRVEVGMVSLDTGISKRNQDMRENHLETDRFPTATFQGGRLVGEPPARLRPGDPTDLEVEGTFTLHGVARRVWWTVTLTLSGPDDRPAIQATSRFPVALADYEIKRPQFLFMKLGEVQQVTVDIRFISSG